jgi:hypothetical protein
MALTSSTAPTCGPQPCRSGSTRIIRIAARAGNQQPAAAIASRTTAAAIAVALAALSRLRPVNHGRGKLFEGVYECLA